MSAQSLANQLGWSITTLDNLEELIYILNSVSNGYGAMVSSLSSANYVNEMLEALMLMSHQFEEETNELINHIKGEHVEYIERQKNAVLQQMKEL